MNCPKCGAPLDDDALFCTFCGTKVERTGGEPETSAAAQEKTPDDTLSAAAPSPTIRPAAAPQAAPVRTAAAPAAAAPQKKLPGKLGEMSMDRLIGLIVGTLLIVIGLIRIFSAGTTISPTSFGGDFYTYTYRGIVAITKILSSIEVSLGWVIVAIGAAIDVRSIRS